MKKSGGIRRQKRWLVSAFREIVERLVADDWCRCSTADGGRTYYIVGFDSHRAELAGEVEFSHWQLPSRDRVHPRRPEPLAEWYSRSQLADRHPDYLARAQKRLVEAGIPEELVDRLVAGEINFSEWTFNQSVPVESRLELVVHLVQSMCISRRLYKEGALDAEQLRDIDTERQKLCLKEIATRFEKVVDRWGQFELLEIEDAQLQEASRSYLYGFYRAAIVLSASAVESHLKRVLNQDLKQMDLVTAGDSAGVLRPEDVASAERVFRKRNRVVHDGSEPNHDEAAEILTLSRKVVSHLVEGSR